MLAKMFIKLDPRPEANRAIFFIFLMFWGLRSKAAALCSRARKSARPCSRLWRLWSGPSGHPCTALGHEGLAVF
ncbi:hypothetical protein SGRA_p0015 (plasmid) [Saprospira grandis str. Lewin]|uniref:Uncharacterized protein n=1 Tax=Saprospira grandis (strain Lewin) TaxID=984262 RepID=H6LAZ0_SAPGL|nr:hypothetical protein SGRA_p0015 [Saprospira grandis str. Lewin]